MKIKIFFFAIAFGFFACSGGDQQTDTTESDSTSTEEPQVTYTNYDGPITSEAITDLAGAVYNETTKRIDMQKAIHYIQACEQYAEANPSDESSPEYLMKAAEMSRNINNFDKALNLYDRVINNYSSYDKAPQAFFLKAFTLDDNMGKKEEAKVLYEEFIKNYPNDDFADDAQFMLETLNKSDAEIIEEFEKKRQESQQ